MKNAPVLDDVLFFRACVRSPQSFQDFLVNGGLLQEHGSKETPHCWLRVSNFGSKLLVPGFQEVVRAVKFADRDRMIIRKEHPLRSRSSTNGSIV